MILIPPFPPLPSLLPHAVVGAGSGRLVKRDTNDTAIYAIVFGLLGVLAVLGMVACWASSTRSNKKAEAIRRRQQRERQLAQQREWLRIQRQIQSDGDLALNLQWGHPRAARPAASDSMSESSARPVRMTRGQPQVVVVNGQQQQQAATADGVQVPAAVHDPSHPGGHGPPRGRPPGGRCGTHVIDSDDDDDSLVVDADRIRIGRRGRPGRVYVSDGDVPRHNVHGGHHHVNLPPRNGPNLTQQWFPRWTQYNQRDGVWDIRAHRADGHRHHGHRVHGYRTRYTPRRRQSTPVHVDFVDYI